MMGPEGRSGAGVSTSIRDRSGSGATQGAVGSWARLGAGGTWLRRPPMAEFPRERLHRFPMREVLERDGGTSLDDAGSVGA